MHPRVLFASLKPIPDIQEKVEFMHVRCLETQADRTDGGVVRNPDIPPVDQVVEIAYHVQDFVIGLPDTSPQAEVEVLDEHNLGRKPQVHQLVSAGLPELDARQHATVKSGNFRTTSLEELVLDGDYRSAPEQDASQSETRIEGEAFSRLDGEISRPIRT